MRKPTMICAGIDAGKRKLDAALEGRLERLQVDNSGAGHGTLSGWLRKHRVKRVGIAASGGYEAAVVAELRRDGFVVIVFQPAQVRADARFVLQRAKNDRIDAGLIAPCAAAAKTIHPAPDPRLSPLADPLTMLDQLSEDIACLKTRRESCRDRRIRAHWNAEIARLKAVRRGELKQLVAAIGQYPGPRLSPGQALATRLDLIASIDGIGLYRRRDRGAHARDRPGDPRTGRRPRRAGARRRQRRTARRAPYRGRPRAAAPGRLQRSVCRRVPLERPAQGPLQTLDRRRQAAQNRARRLRQKAPDRRQYRCPARHAVASEPRYRVALPVSSWFDRGTVSSSRPGLPRTPRTDAVKSLPRRRPGMAGPPPAPPAHPSTGHSLTAASTASCCRHSGPSGDRHPIDFGGNDVSAGFERPWPFSTGVRLDGSGWPPPRPGRCRNSFSSRGARSADCL